MMTTNTESNSDSEQKEDMKSAEGADSGAEMKGSGSSMDSGSSESKKKTWMYVLFGCLGVFVLIGLMIGAFAFYAAREVKKAIPDLEEELKNIDLQRELESGDILKDDFSFDDEDSGDAAEEPGDSSSKDANSEPTSL